MSHWENAEEKGHPGREYWSRRNAGRCLVWGRQQGKMEAHRQERRLSRRIICTFLDEFSPYDPTKIDKAKVLFARIKRMRYDHE